MYSQKSYPKVKLGTCNLTIAQDGCFLTSFCNLLVYQQKSTQDPEAMNELFIKEGLYSSGCLINAPKVAEYFNRHYAKLFSSTGEVCICETDNFKKLGYPQHFFLYNPATHKRVDPLDLNPDWEDNDYRIVSYRLFTPIAKPPAPMPPVSPKIEPQEPLSPEPMQTPQTTPQQQILNDLKEMKSVQGPMTLWDLIIKFLNWLKTL